MPSLYVAPMAAPVPSLYVPCFVTVTNIFPACLRHGGPPVRRHVTNGVLELQLGSHCPRLLLGRHGATYLYRCPYNQPASLGCWYAWEPAATPLPAFSATPATPRPRLLTATHLLLDGPSTAVLVPKPGGGEWVVQMFRGTTLVRSVVPPPHGDREGEKEEDAEEPRLLAAFGPSLPSTCLSVGHHLFAVCPQGRLWTLDLTRDPDAAPGGGAAAGARGGWQPVSLPGLDCFPGSSSSPPLYCSSGGGRLLCLDPAKTRTSMNCKPLKRELNLHKVGRSPGISCASCRGTLINCCCCCCYC